MKKIKFVIFGDLQKGTNTKDLYDEILSRGYECVTMDSKDTVLDFSNERFVATNKDVVLNDADIFLFRSITGYVREAKILMERLMSEGKIIVDEGACRRIVEGKIFQASKLQRAGVSIPRTCQACDFKVWKSLLGKMEFPIVVKPVKGSRGQGVAKIKTLQEALKLFREQPCEYFAQEYFELDGDFRIFVVKGKVLGGIKRFVVPGDFRTNCSLGGRAETISVGKEMKSIARRAAKAVGYEVAGVDVVEHGGRLYVLEVNASPQWKGFKATTGINPAGAIIDLALEKYHKRRR